VVALDLLRGEVEGLSGESQVNIAFVPLDRPLLAGPGAIAAITVFLREASKAPERVGVAPWPACSSCCGLRCGSRGWSGECSSSPGIELVTRISGLLLTAIAVQLVADAVREFIREGV
jgi:multiple antibiotic resistance protein